MIERKNCFYVSFINVIRKELKKNSLSERSSSAASKKYYPKSVWTKFQEKIIKGDKFSFVSIIESWKREKATLSTEASKKKTSGINNIARSITWEKELSFHKRAKKRNYSNDITVIVWTREESFIENAYAGISSSLNQSFFSQTLSLASKKSHCSLSSWRKQKKTIRRNIRVISPPIKHFRTDKIGAKDNARVFKVYVKKN